MPCLSDEDLEGLQIEQSVFHIVGPGNEHFQLLEAFDATPYTSFFLGRIRSVNSGNCYRFLDDSPVRTQLGRISDHASTFQEESEKLATSFNEAHGGSAAIGAFLLFSLLCPSGRVFALLKFEDEKVLSYALKKGSSGKPAPDFGEIEKTFVQNRNALQKAAMIRLSDESDTVFIVDRQNPQRPAAYFERFLHVRRLRTEQELTKELVSITRKIAAKHREHFPADVFKSLTQRLFDASQSGGSVDGDRLEDWFKSIVGPLPDDSPPLKAFRAELKREGMAGESFTLAKDAVTRPRNRRVETAGGVRLIFPSTMENSQVVIDEAANIITIKDTILVNDAELKNTDRSRT